MAAVASSAPEPTAVEASKKLAKPERPDEDAFRKAEAAAKEENEKAQKDLSEIKRKLDLAKPGGGQKNPRQQEIKAELAEIRSQVAEKNNSRLKIEDQIQALQESISARVKELNSKKGSMQYRKLEDLEDAVAKLDSKVSSGAMKIVDEKRALQEISNLNKQKKNFAAFEEQQKAIDADRVRLKEMKEKKQDPELKELNEKYNVLDKEFKAIKEEQDSAFKDLNALRDERTRLQGVQQEKWQALKQIQDEYYQNRNAFRAYEREARKIREDRRKKEQAEYLLKKKRAIATEKLDAASQPAFALDIITCESLIAFFDPESAEAARKAKLASGPRELAAKASREVDSAAKPGYKPLPKKEDKEEESYFVGSGGKKKGKKARGGAAAAAEETAEPASAAGKFNLNLGVLEELRKIDAPTPSSKEEVPQVLEKIREKLQYYKDNQDRVTQENIAKAKKEIERLEQMGEEPAYETSPAAAAKEPDTPAAEEEKEEEAAPAAES